MARHASAFHDLARAAGIELRANVARPWLTRNGHLTPEIRDRLPSDVVKALDRILTALGGDAVTLAAKTRGAMSADFLLEPHGVVVEYDEIQHFTTARQKTLALYPPDTPLGFDLAAYGQLVKCWRARGDRGFAHKQAPEFPGDAGRQRQRAYFDALRDLVAPHFDDGLLIRIAAPDNDYAAAVAALQASANAGIVDR
jgi:hypothetical protein